MMGKILKADLASWFFHKNSFDPKKEWFKWKMITISSEIFKKWLRHIKLKIAFFFKTKFIREYETVIFSGDCTIAIRNTTMEQKKIFYCHTPPRYIFDRNDWYYKKIPFILRPIFKLLIWYFRKLYLDDIKKFDLVLTNSKNTQERIKKYIWIPSTIVYPPVDTSAFRFIWQKDYYISFSRLSAIKRVDRIVEAFKQMPDKKLIVTYGRNDPQKDDVMALAWWVKNITFLTDVDDDQLHDLVGNAIASIYIPVNEDFWMIAIESLSAWKPVIAVNDGGLKETIIDNKTWFLINKDPQVKDLIKVVNEMTPKVAKSMQKACEERAKEFSLETFENKLIDILK